jgi:hypothetical protein
MIQRAYFLHYRVIREVIANGIIIATAVLVSYLIFWARL